jgi:hypothetical protein
VSTVCSVRLCGRRAVARRFCGRHYQKWSAYRDPTAGRTNVLHGEVGRGGAGERRPSPEYSAWQAMKNRCLNKRCGDFRYYGGRGISVCARWRNNFPAFLEDMGRRPSPRHTLDRKNTNGHYSSQNCRWATRAEQSRNRRPFTVDGRKLPSAENITIDGVTRTIAGWARALGVNREMIRGRLHRGWPPRKAVMSKAWSTRPKPNQARYQ